MRVRCGARASRCAALLLALVPCRPALAADCDRNQILAAVAEEEKVAADGRWNKTAVGPMLRGAIIEARKQKRIQALCTAQGDAARAKQAELDLHSALIDNPTVFVEYAGYRASLSELEEKRFDKQVGTTQTTTGSTSITSKGAVPLLLGLAVERGALTRSINGTSVTFRATPLGVIKALAKQGYIASAPDPQPGTLSAALANLSFAITFDASRGADARVLAGESQEVSGYSFRYQLLNRRDPRHVRYARAWQELRTGEQSVLAQRINQLNDNVRSPGSAVARSFDDWREQTRARLTQAKLDEVDKVVREQAEAFGKLLPQFQEISPSVAAAGDALVDYFTRRNDAIKRITKSWMLALEYTSTLQGLPDGVTPAPAGGMGVPAAASALPDLSNFRLVFAKGFMDGPELTGNVGLTIFTNLPEGSTTSRLRDFQASLQLDVPLPEIQNIGSMVLSLSGLFLSLQEEPLGQKVLVNGVAVSTTGNIGLIQAKLTLPVKGSGVAIPVSVTWASRSELVKEHDVRANFGITLDFDKIFAKR